MISMLDGVIAAPLTMFKDNGEVDYKETEKYFGFLVEKGINGLFACGTTSEGLSLNVSEHEEIFKLARSIASNKAKVIANCSNIRIEESRELARIAKKANVDAIATLPPLYYRVSEKEMIEYISVIVQTVKDLPTYVYNIPSLAVNKVTLNVVSNLLEKHENFFGMKDSSGDFGEITRFIDLRKKFPKFEIAVGFDRAFFPLLMTGVNGTVSGPAAVFPEPFVKVYSLFKKGNLEEARKAQEKMMEISSVIGEGYDMSALKKALQFRGFGNGKMRLPLMEYEGKNLRDKVGFAEKEIQTW
jgi:4-hydroxy-tetrahydrodipicolinate synthase